ncbi:Deoxyuridine 5'-triphosphate nucleotidohydrolase, partial [Chlamydiales bacterium SCGC AG-110-P3]
MTQNSEIEIHVTQDGDGDLPSYSTSEAAGADIRAHIDGEQTLEPGERTLIPTGVKVAIPVGYEIQVRPRSGLALKNGITVLNTPGTIDSDYRGEICVILINHGSEAFIITPHMRIAQLVVAPVTRAQFVPVKELAGSTRGEGGF